MTDTKTKRKIDWSEVGLAAVGVLAGVSIKMNSSKERSTTKESKE